MHKSNSSANIEANGLGDVYSLKLQTGSEQQNKIKYLKLPLLLGISHTG